MLLDEIGARLAAESIATTAGEWRLHLGMLRDSTALPHTAVAIIETPGAAPVDPVDYGQPGFQVLVRGEPMNTSTGAYTDARQKAEDVRQALHMRGNEALSGTAYAVIRAEQEPFFGGEDANLRPLFIVNFRAIRQST